MKKLYFYFVVCVVFIGFIDCQSSTSNLAAGCRQVDEFTIERPKDFLKGYPAFNADGTINVLVEIPAGTNEKWEVNAKLPDGTKPEDGKLRRDFKDGGPRTIQYLAYPGNYGIIPQTLGGDSDPLDILILGHSLPRGTKVRAKYIGVLKMLDGGEVDDKIVGVFDGSVFFGVDNLRQLDEEYPGITFIVETWFAHYKGAGEVEVLGWEPVETAAEIIDEAVEAFTRN